MTKKLMKPKISIIIPTLNEENLLENCLKSIKSQTYRNYEIIIVDSLSKDRTVEIAKRYTNKVIIKKTNIAEAKNVGIAYAEGEILLFLDADATLASSSWLQNLLEAYKDPQVVGVACRLLTSEKTFARLILRLYNSFNLGLLAFMGCYLIGGSCVSYRKEIFKKIKFNESLEIGEDYDFSLRARCLGKLTVGKNLTALISPRRISPKYLIFTFLNAVYLVFFRKPISNYLKKIFYQRLARAF